MDWRDAVTGHLYDSIAEEELKAVLVDLYPAFEAPVEPRAWMVRAEQLRREALEQVFLRGYPPELVNKEPRVVWGEVLRLDDSYVIRKLRYEIYPDYWIPALLYEPTALNGRVPVVLNPIGHFTAGKANEDQQIRCANLARRGILALNMEFIGMGELDGDVFHHRQGHLNLTGIAGVGLMYLALTKGLDVLLAHEYADAQRVAVTGLSGGGWQTLILAALDTRVTMAAPVAGYMSLRSSIPCIADIGCFEQPTVDMETVLGYEEMTAMLAPRPALVILNEHDEVGFATAKAQPDIVNAAQPTYQALNAVDHFVCYNCISPGTHTYGADNRHQFYRFLNRHFNLATPTEDIHLPHDILPESTLTVGLPAEQKNLLSIARKKAYALCAEPRRAQTAVERNRLRAQLARVLRVEDYTVVDREIGRIGDKHHHLLCLGPWTVPVTGFTPAGATESALRIHDDGRSHCDSPPEAGCNLFAVDIFDTGENCYSTSRKSMLECAGHRLLGIQVGQILALSRWIAHTTGLESIHLTATGFVTSAAGLMATALEPDLFQSLSISSNLVTLKSLFDWPVDCMNRNQALFCFGLLVVCDLPDLIDLLEQVTLNQYGRT